ncbi:MAG TPA: hypothetical protein VJS18_08230 [Paraburkholderia sp.]|nr:hypothetical protein [Paraburkholderia sp.]
MNRLAILAASVGLALVTVSAFAAPVSEFPNLASADQLIDQSSAHIQEARKANHDDFGGHAERAVQLLQQAKAELNAAAIYRATHH